MQAAIENEVQEYLEARRGQRTESGERAVVRNGHLPQREVVTGVGPIEVRQPRLRHRDGGSFTSQILPKYMRRVPSIDALVPALYLKGISTGDFTQVLSAILGEETAGLSATNIVRREVIKCAIPRAETSDWWQRDARLLEVAKGSFVRALEKNNAGTLGGCPRAEMTLCSNAIETNRVKFTLVIH